MNTTIHNSLETVTSGTRFPLEGVREVHDDHNLNRPPSILPNNNRFAIFAHPDGEDICMSRWCTRWGTQGFSMTKHDCAGDTSATAEIPAVFSLVVATSHSDPEPAHAQLAVSIATTQNA